MGGEAWARPLSLGACGYVQGALLLEGKWFSVLVSLRKMSYSERPAATLPMASFVVLAGRPSPLTP